MKVSSLDLISKLKLARYHLDRVILSSNVDWNTKHRDGTAKLIPNRSKGAIPKSECVFKNQDASDENDTDGFKFKLPKCNVNKAKYDKKISKKQSDILSRKSACTSEISSSKATSSDTEGCSNEDTDESEESYNSVYDSEISEDEKRFKLLDRQVKAKKEKKKVKPEKMISLSKAIRRLDSRKLPVQ